jgi:hypothetical protein
MKIFSCPTCREPVYFENSRCTRCAHVLAYLPEHATLTALEPVQGTDVFVSLDPLPHPARFRLCGQIDHGACNWAVAEVDAHRFCRACRLNDVIPNLAEPKAKDACCGLNRANAV